MNVVLLFSFVSKLHFYKTKIQETINYGGDQLLLQGGHHPELGLDYYTRLFRDLKEGKKPPGKICV